MTPAEAPEEKVPEESPDDRLALVPRQARRFQGEPAGVVTRTVAAAADALTVATTLVVSYAGLHAVMFMADPRDFEVLRTSLGVGVALAIGVCVVYLTAAWATTGRTYGFRLMGLRLVARDRRPPRLLRALLRALLCVGFPVGLLWSVVGDRRRSLQDLLLGTAVIHDWPSRSSAAPAVPVRLV